MSADPTLNHEAVKAYRDHFKFCPNAGTRNDIIATVTDLNLWKEVLTSWGYWKEGKWKKFNPLNARRMLSEYERRASKAKRSNGTDDIGQRKGDDGNLSQRVSERSDRGLLPVQEGTRVQLRAGCQTLDEIFTEALRKTY